MFHSRSYNTGVHSKVYEQDGMKNIPSLTHNLGKIFSIRLWKLFFDLLHLSDFVAIFFAIPDFLNFFSYPR